MDALRPGFATATFRYRVRGVQDGYCGAGMVWLGLEPTASAEYFDIEMGFAFISGY